MNTNESETKMSQTNAMFVEHEIDINQEELANINQDYETLEEKVARLEAELQALKAQGTVTVVSQRQQTIENRVNELLLQTEPALSYKQVLDQVLSERAGVKTSMNCVRWYANKLSQLGIRQPIRPRSILK